MSRSTITSVDQKRTYADSRSGSPSFETGVKKVSVDDAVSIKETSRESKGRRAEVELSITSDMRPVGLGEACETRMKEFLGKPYSKTKSVSRTVTWIGIDR